MTDTFSEVIRNYRGGIFKNPYQGTDKKVVFVCSMGILRSATGARIYAHKYNTRTAGTWSEALIPLSENLILWADELVFVNRTNYDGIRIKFEGDEDLVATIEYKAKVLDIPDNYEHMHPELIKAFEEQYERIHD
jgi:predicted protein tyrosine phosphatase